MKQVNRCVAPLVPSSLCHLDSLPMVDHSLQPVSLLLCSLSLSLSLSYVPSFLRLVYIVHKMYLEGNGPALEVSTDLVGLAPMPANTCSPAWKTNGRASAIRDYHSTNYQRLSTSILGSEIRHTDLGAWMGGYQIGHRRLVAVARHAIIRFRGWK